MGIPENRTRMVVAFLYLLYIQLLLTEYVQCNVTQKHTQTPDDSSTTVTKIEQNECQTNADCVGSPICKYAPNPKHCLCKKYCLEPSRNHPRSKTNFTAKCPKLCVTTSTSARTTSTTNSKYFKSPCQSKEDCVKMAVCKDSETRSKKMRPFYYKGI